MPDSDTSEQAGALAGLIIGSGMGIAIAWWVMQKLPFMRDKKIIKAYVKDRLLDDLQQHGPMTLPQIIGRSGASDGFMNRGSAVMEVGKLCLARKLIEETPPDCPLTERVSRRTYRLP